ncbi:hypothetical protein Lesp02_44280 [Lentzea sp. NBRC 105346]|uniref:hypothetical protein n=1 Tax=Lentzea sp. NBRC 105346 TaxID=3032205 RepID=UPI0024A491E6|nr:hypothetical protein [Lentzea sp. NBRC 105346]GLZ32240.1 hypothetical protein Lesp02_44280 [Lentzea sp. NBRC 105346]
MNDNDVADPLESGETEVALSELLARVRTEKLPPPLRSQWSLPFDQLAPPTFERLVAETVWLVDGLNCIRIYGRPGQDQGGLDLIGYQGTDLHVYQVRRINNLTATELRKAVTDFTDPIRSNRSKAKKPGRRVDAQRFVLVTACTVKDTAVEDELRNLKRTFAGDLEIDLYDGQELFRKLHNRGSLIHGIFGPEWAKAVCGHEPSAKPTTPDGRALLNDPVEMLGFGELRGRAEALDAQAPHAAAELFGELSKALSDKGFVAYGRAWKARERDALRAAGDHAGAFAVAMDLLLELYEAGQHIRSEVNLAGVLAESLDPTAGAAALVAAALNDWPEQGYDLAPVADALKTLAEANHDLAGRLTLAVAEQIVTDDDPADDFAVLLDVAGAVVGRMSGQLRTRLECCIADLKVHGGEDPVEMFADLTRQAHGGWLPEPIGALALRRAAHALAFAGPPQQAIEAYRRAVIEAAHADHGGDTRDALRSIAFLSDTLDTRQDPMRSARAIGTRTRLLPGSDDAALATLDALVDGQLPDAHRAAHHWVRHERISGSLLDEVLARKRYGKVFADADMPAHAVRQFVLAGARKEAVAAASTASEPLDVSRYLTVRFPVWVHASAAAVCAEQADLIPDDRAADTASLLVTIIDAESPRSFFSPDPVKYAVGALGALGHRLPTDVAQHLLPKMLSLVPREPGHYRFIDAEMLAFFSACAEKAEDDVAVPAVKALVECARQKIHRADRHLYNLNVRRSEVLELVKEQARSGEAAAVHVLAAWEQCTDEVVAAAREACNGILSHPVGQERNSWEIGDGASYGALLLHTALASVQDEQGSELIDLRDQVIDHLTAWAEDDRDIASSRMAALNALRVLHDRVPDEIRRELCRRLIALHDTPDLNQHDLFDQQSLHPLSRFRIDAGSEHLAAEALLTAAFYTDDPETAEAIHQRLQPARVTALPNRTDAMLRGKTLVQVNRVFPIALGLLAMHPAPGIRQAAAVCWANQDERDPGLASIFAADSDRGVRRNLADCLARINNEPHFRNLEAVLDQLKKDPSAIVRRATNEAR